jgi:hypothetical protein
VKSYPRAKVVKGWRQNKNVHPEKATHLEKGIDPETVTDLARGIGVETATRRKASIAFCLL